MADIDDLNISSDSPSVREHLSLLQGVINRMAGNSSSCKTWCISIVAAILLLVARTDTTAYALLALIPALLFFYLDAYYLTHEKAFRDAYDAFVQKVHSGSVELADLYVIRPVGGTTKRVPSSMASPAVWPFYGMLVLAILLVFALA